MHNYIALRMSLQLGVRILSTTILTNLILTREVLEVARGSLYSEDDYMGKNICKGYIKVC